MSTGQWGNDFYPFVLDGLLAIPGSNLYKLNQTFLHPCLSVATILWTSGPPFLRELLPFVNLVQYLCSQRCWHY